MVSTFFDELAPRWDPNVPRPRGLLPVPAFVEEHVACEKVRLHPYVNDEAAKRIRDDHTLQYYFEGETIAYRLVPEGVEVLAVGLDEIGEMIDKIPPEQRPGVLVAQI
jgi:hypothetical protein